MAPTIFSCFQDTFLNDFIKNPQTRNARAFLPLNISAVGSVARDLKIIPPKKYLERKILNFFFGETGLP